MNINMVLCKVQGGIVEKSTNNFRIFLFITNKNHIGDFVLLWDEAVFYGHDGNRGNV